MSINVWATQSTRIMQDTKVDFIKRTIEKPIHIVQYDKSMPVIAVSLFQNGNAYTIPDDAGYSIKVRWGKPDRTFVYKDVLGCDITRNIVYFDVDNQMSYYDGNYNPVIEISYVVGGVSTLVACSSFMNIIIDKNPIQENDIASSSEYLDLTAAKDAAENAADSAEASKNNADIFAGNAENSKNEAQTILDSIQEEYDSFAKIDGSYCQMNVGSSEQLLSPDGSEDTSSWRYRTSGGSKDITDGSVSIMSIKGKTRKFNQLINPDNYADNKTENNVIFTKGTGADANKIIVTVGTGGCSIITNYKVVMSDTALINGHKYLIGGSPSNSSDSTIYLKDMWSSNIEAGYNGVIFPGTVGFYRINIVVSNICPAGTYVFYPQFFDLTAMYGTGNEPTTPQEFFDEWGRDYKTYDAGSIISVKPTAIKTISFNQFTGNTWINGSYISAANGVISEDVAGMYCADYIKVFENTAYEYTQETSYGGMGFRCYDANKVYIGPVNISNSVCVTLPNTEYIRVSFYTTGGSDIPNQSCMHLVHSGYRNGQYENPWSQSLSINLDEFPYGLNEINGIYDIKDYEHKNNIRRFGAINLSSMSWIKDDAGYFQTQFQNAPSDLKHNTVYEIPNILCARYTTGTITQASTIDKYISCYWNDSTSNYIRIKDSSYSTVDSFIAAINGVYLVYELAEPIITNMLVNENNVYRVSDFGTEEYIGNSYKFDTITVNYISNLRDKLRNLPYEEDLNAELDSKAVKNGLETGLIAGSALNLVSDKGLTDLTPFTKRALIDVTGVKSGVSRYKKVKGNTLIFNQLINPANYPDESTMYNTTFTPNRENGTITVVVSSLNTGYSSYSLDSISIISNHKYLVLTNLNNDNVYINVLLQQNETYVSEFNVFTNYIFVAQNTYNSATLRCYAANGCPAGTYLFKPQLIDLTLMFGAGNEPASSDEFKKQFPKAYYEYNAGELINSKPVKIKSNELNQFNGTNWIANNLFNISASNYYYCSDYIPVQGNTVYKYIQNYMACSAYIRFFDNEKNALNDYLSIALITDIGGSFTTPSNCAYVWIGFYKESSGIPSQCMLWIPGTDNTNLTVADYEPYEEYELNINTDTFEDGMGSVNYVYDYKDYIERKNHKKLKSVQYTSSDVTQETGFNYTNLIYYKVNKPTDYVGYGDIYGNVICDKYTFSSDGDWDNASHIGYIFQAATYNYFWIGFPLGTTLAQAQAAINGMKIEYELVTEEITDFEPSESSGLIVNGHGLEWIEQTEGFISPLTHETKYQEDLKKNIEDTIGKFNALSTALNATFVLDSSGNWICTIH